MTSSRNLEMAKALSHRSSGNRKGLTRVFSAQNLKRFYTRDRFIQMSLVGLLCAVVVIIASPDPIIYQVGEVAESTIRADRNLRLVNQEATKAHQREAAKLSPPVFILNDELGKSREELARNIFKQGREIAAILNHQEIPLTTTQVEMAYGNLKNNFYQIFNLPPKNKAWEKLIKQGFTQDLEQWVLSLSTEIMDRGLLDQPNYFVGQRHRPAVIIAMSTGREYAVPTTIGLWDLNAANRFLDWRTRRLATTWTPEGSALILNLVRGLVKPNLTLDQEETAQRVAEAQHTALTIYSEIEPGEIIVRENTVITPEDFEKITLMVGASNNVEKLALRFLGLFIILFVFLNSGLSLANQSLKVGFKPMPIREQLFVVSLLLAAALIAYGSQTFGRILALNFDFLDQRTIFYAMPLSAISMLATIFFGTRKALYIAVFVGVVAAAVSPANTHFLTLIYCYNGSIIAIWCLRHINEREQIIRAILGLTIINSLTMIGLTLYNDLQWGPQVAYNLGAAVISGIMSAIIASGLTPLIEAAFGFNTNFKIMELGNLDRPILRELMLVAPGTYHHSVIVGAMVEAAAEAIGANTHLAKVGAYYHDIGKLKKPHYFVENQIGENRHDTLAPSMSALILIGHVRDGAELARHHHLPQGIVDIVEQHHGTSLMSYFYHKAKEQRQEGQPEINEGNYRYPGPRPQSKESGLVMLGDICEAATRSLAEPTPVKISTMVRHLVSQIFSDGQLDDCDLRTREISIVVDKFTTILTGIYHRRVAYPGATLPKDASQSDDKAIIKNESKDIYGHLLVESTKGTTH